MTENIPLQLRFDLYVFMLQHVDKLLERSQHEHEMEQLKKEKEEALAEEVKTTKAGESILHRSLLLILPLILGVVLSLNKLGMSASSRLVE